VLAEAPPYRPPIHSPAVARIELIEAVRLTLGNDPNLLLSGEDVRLQQGVLQELSGQFDWTLVGDLSWEHRRQELRQGTVQAEQDARSDLAFINEKSCAFEMEQEELIQQITDEINMPTPPGEDRPDFSDTTLEAQIRVIDALILAAEGTDEERAEQLRRVRQGVLQRQLEASQELERRAEQSCQESAEDLERLGDVPEEEEFDTARMSLHLDKLFRNGVFLSPFLDGTYNSTAFVGKRDGFFIPREDPSVSPITGIPLFRFIDFGGKNVEDLYRMEVGFDINIPLLRDRGADAVAASERAASVDLEASELTLRHAASQSALQTTLAFWNLLATERQIAIIESSVALERRLLEITEALIGADELPGVERARATASVASALAQSEQVARALVTARLDLIRAMGFDVETLANAPLAAGDFPPAPRLDELGRLVEAQLASSAVQARDDVKAFNALVESGGILARAAQINLRSRLDLSTGVWAIAQGESSISEALDRWAAPSWRVGLLLEKPFGNNIARGQLVQAEAQVRQRQISAGDLERNVRIGVVDTLGSLAQAVDELARAEEAAASYEQTISAELEKLRLGDASVLDAVVTEQQRTGAQLAVVAARQQVANLIAQLRFETGTLVTVGDQGPTITQEALTTVPALGAAQ
jgi:outer membrane protein TolC